MIVASGLLAIPLSAIRVGPVPLIKHVVDDLFIHKDSRNFICFRSMSLAFIF